MSDLILEIADLRATQTFGQRLGAQLEEGHVLGLCGPLGSGKTTLTKAIAAGAGVADTRSVTSPTFVLVNEYEARREAGSLCIYHIDVYRLRGGGDLEALGFEEMPLRGAVLIEWADRVEEVLPADRLMLTIMPLDDHRRRFTFRATGPRAESLIRQWQI